MSTMEPWLGLPTNVQPSFLSPAWKATVSPGCTCTYFVAGVSSIDRLADVTAAGLPKFAGVGATDVHAEMRAKNEGRLAARTVCANLTISSILEFAMPNCLKAMARSHTARAAHSLLHSFRKALRHAVTLWTAHGDRTSIISPANIRLPVAIPQPTTTSAGKCMPAAMRDQPTNTT